MAIIVGRFVAFPGSCRLHMPTGKAPPSLVSGTFYCKPSDEGAKAKAGFTIENTWTNAREGGNVVP